MNLTKRTPEDLTALFHELRTPLTSILSWAQLLQTQATSQTLLHGLKVIEQNALLQAKLIDQLLYISDTQRERKNYDNTLA